jgi:hypothetical protein
MSSQDSKIFNIQSIFFYFQSANFFWPAAFFFSEKELNKGYADIKYSYLIEIKYISGSEGKKQEVIEAKLQQLKVEAEAQLKTYEGDETFKKSIGKTTLIKLVVVFHGSELKYIGPAG